MDDQKTISVEQLRITQDWNEVSGQWTPRKNWLFLELLEEHMQGMLVDVSVRQVWQILRSKEEFEKRKIDWTCGERSLWDVMVLEVIRDMKLTADRVRDGVNLLEGSKEMRNETNGVVSKGQEEETQTLLASADFDGNVLLKPESDLITLTEVEEDSIPQLILQNEENRSVSELPSCWDSCALTLTGNDESSNDLGMKDYNSWNNILNFSRYVLDTEVLPTDPDPTPISTMGDDELDNLNGSHDDNGEFIQPRALSGLPSNGDKFACISSDVGQEIEVHEAGGAVLDAAKSHGCSNDLSSSGAFGNFSLSDEAQGIGVRDTTNGLRNGDDPTPRRKGTWLPIVGPEKLPGGAKYCPDALINCLQSRSHRRKSKDNGHYSVLLRTRINLLNVGWKIELKKDETKIQRFRYISPDGRQTMYSIRKVSEYLTENRAKIQSQSPQNGHQSSVNVNVIDELLDSNVEEDVGRHQRKVVPINVASSTCSETPALDLPERDVKPKDSASEVTVIAAEYCPQAVIDWYNVASDGRRPKGAAASLLILRAKKHLLAVGWNFWYTQKHTRQELRYTSPKGKNYISLVTACKAYIEEGEFLGNMGPIHGQYKKGGIELYGSSQSRELPEFDNVQVNNSFPLAFNLNRNQTNALSQSSQDEKRSVLGHNATSQQPKKRKPFGAPVKQLDGNKQTRVMRSSKRVRQILVATPMHQMPRTVLSCLIDNNVVLPRAKVYYKGRNDHRKLAEGRITHGGIRCNCCHKVFGLTKFEAHTGVTSRQPAANIFLEDGRSLLQCQKQMLHDNKADRFALESRGRIKRNQPCNKTDDICSVCHYGGKLLLCDQCPSAFHLSCLGLKALPEGQWFCPSCRCGICDQSEFNGDTQRFTGKTILYCDQCEREYHVGCIRQRGATELESCPKGNWFCSEKCEEIFVGLHKLLGKPILVGVDNLSWTILKASKDDYHNLVASESETRVEHHNKLNVALGVMHESFKPIKEQYTKIDLIENVLFNKWSELNRLNFWGFYTVLLERDDELISVATVRVYGEKVAEVPLVATRFQYRCRGMCRILMDFLERKLAEFGVERLILPAVPQVLHTWTTSFGFSKMTSKERLEFLKYTFLDFQDTTMCQKILTMMPTRTSIESTGGRNILGDVLNQSDENNEMDMSSVASEVTREEEEIEQSQVVEQIPLKKSRKMADDPDWIPGQW